MTTAIKNGTIVTADLNCTADVLMYAVAESAEVVE